MFKNINMRRLYTILLAAAILCTSCIKDREKGADLAVGDVIPDFKVTMNDGSTVNAGQLRSGISCIVFFTTVCQDCRETLPHVQRLYDEYMPQGVTFALISRAETEETVAPHWESEGFTMPYSPQKDRSVYELFASSRIPRVYICKDGVIRAIFTDTPANPTYEDMKALIEEL